MPWVRAALRGQKVFAKADESGRLVDSGGRVEIRYKANDGRKYEARASNLAVEPGPVLPEETCAAASAVDKPAASEQGATRSGRTAAKGAAAKPAVIPEGAIIAYADGACSGNPGPAGLGVVVIDGPVRVEISEYLGTGTNNIAELTAIQRAIEAADATKPCVVHTDSQYSIGVLSKGWKAKANTELVARVKAVFGGRKGARLVYVPGHAGVILNERADALAREAVQNRATRRDRFESKKPEGA